MSTLECLNRMDAPSFHVASNLSRNPVLRLGRPGRTGHAEHGTRQLERRMEGFPGAAIPSSSANEDLDHDVLAVGFALVRLNCACRRAVTQSLPRSRRVVSWRHSLRMPKAAGGWPDFVVPRLARLFSGRDCSGREADKVDIHGAAPGPQPKGGRHLG